jgi:hypothetical protein
MKSRFSISSIEDVKKSVNSYYPGSLCRRLSKGPDENEREMIFNSEKRNSCYIPRVVKAHHTES